MTGGTLQSIMLRRPGLDQDPALLLPSSGPAGNLNQKRKGPFGTAEIGEIETVVGIDNPDQCHIWKIMPFGEHLCADQDINLAGQNRVDQPLVSPLGGCRIPIHAGNATPGHMPHQVLFKPFGATPLRHQVMPAATRADIWRHLVIITVVAEQLAG